MRNAVYQSFSLQLCSFAGNNQVQMSNSSDVSENVYGSSSFRDYQVSSDHHLGNIPQLSTVEIPQTLNYLHRQGLLSSSMYENAAQRNTFPVPHSEAAIENARKRTMKGDGGGSINNRTGMEESKKKKAMCIEDQRPFQTTEEQPSNTQEQRAPVRRSQKIGDRITALQKLVSPFGKTDTASVLQQTCVCIKLLQEQIRMLSAPYFTVRPLLPQGVEGRKVDLRGRGLCLVPVSFNQNPSKEDRVDHSISTIIPPTY